MSGDLYVFNFGNADDGPSPYEQEQARIRPRYVDLVGTRLGLDAATAERLIAVIFDHRHEDGRACPCGCHPRFSSLHDDGFDCSCSWDQARRQAARDSLQQWHNSAAAQELRNEYEAEQAAIAVWLGGQPGVTATRLTTNFSEQWQGEVDSRSFYFRERHGSWRIELDLEPTGRFLDRFTGVGDNGELSTEPVETTEGHVIAEGIDRQLGQTPVDHLDFIVRTIRNYLWAEQCDHAGALIYCPKCGIPTP